VVSVTQRQFSKKLMKMKEMEINDASIKAD
jgi:hypothetical protein